MGDLPIKNRQNQLNKINAQEKNNFRGIFNLNEALKSFSSARPRTRGYHPRAYGNLVNKCFHHNKWYFLHNHGIP